MSALRKLLVSSILGSALLVAPSAFADGISIAASALPNETRAKLVFMVEARPSIADAPKLRPGQPVSVLLR